MTHRIAKLKWNLPGIKVSRRDKVKDAVLQGLPQGGLNGFIKVFGYPMDARRTKNATSTLFSAKYVCVNIYSFLFHSIQAKKSVQECYL